MSRTAGESGVVPDTARSQEKAARWAAFSSAVTFDAKATHWLALLCARIPSARAATLHTKAEGTDEPPVLVARWDNTPEILAAEFEQSARQGLVRNIPLVRSVGRNFHLIVQPDGYPAWAIVVECLPVQPRELQAGLEELRWGAGWLVAAIEQAAGHGAILTAGTLGLAVAASRAAGRERDVVSSSGALAREIAAAFPGTLVSVGVFRHNVLSLAGRAGTPTLPRPDDDARREALVQLAMQLGRTQVASALPDPGPQVRLDVLPDAGVRVAALPLIVSGNTAGVLLCERQDGVAFSADDLARLEETAQIVAPLIELLPVTRSSAVSRERRLVAGMFGQVRMKWKLALIALMAVVLVVLGATGDYEARATATVEGTAPRRIGAPFDGRLADLLVRPGDTVRRGQVLARMDDTELQIEKVRLSGERDKIAQAAREVRDEATAPPSEAQANRRKEIEARLVAIEERLARMQVLSPTDGVVVSVLSTSARQMLRPDETLVTLGHADGYRLVLSVPAPDLVALREGQSGAVRFGNDDVAFTITRIGATEAEGMPVRIEAQAHRLSPQVQPGMQGVGTIQVGTRKLVWIWWRRLQQDAGAGG